MNPEYPEIHMNGILSIENEEIVKPLVNKPGTDVGIQISNDGRIWLCVDGVAFIRFKQTRKEKGKEHE